MYRLPHKLHLNDRKNDCSFLLKKTGFFQVAPQATKSMKIYLKKLIFHSILAVWRRSVAIPINSRRMQDDCHPGRS